MIERIANGEPTGSETRCGIVLPDDMAGRRRFLTAADHLLKDADWRLVLMGSTRVRRKRNSRVRNLTGRASRRRRLRELACCDIALCCGDACDLAVEVGIPLVGVFLGRHHTDILPGDFESYTIIYPNLTSCPSGGDVDLAAAWRLVRPAPLASAVRQRANEPSAAPDVLRFGSRRDGRRPYVSIVVATRVSGDVQLESTRRCLHGISANTPVPHEVILVDGGSDEGFVGALKQMHNGRAVFMPAGRTLPDVWNSGVEMAAGDVIVLLHNDQYPGVGWLDDLLPHLNGNGVAVAGVEMWHVTAAGELLRGHEDSPRDFVRACGLAGRRDVLAQLGSFDAELGPNFPEAADLCYRAREMGYAIASTESTALRHTGALTLSRCGSDLADSMLLLRRRWPDRFDVPPAPPDGSDVDEAGSEEISEDARPGVDDDAGNGGHPDSQAGPNDLRARLGVSPTAFVVGYLGRLSTEKRIADLINAFAASNADHLVIGGWGKQREQLAALVERLGLDDRVTFAGAVHSVGAFYRAIDVFALVSESEGMPLTVVEAALAGVPIVATTVGAIPDMLEHGSSAFFTEPGDVAGIAAAVDTLRADPVLAYRLSCAARIAMESEHTSARMGQRYQSVLIDARNRRKQPARAIFRRGGGIGDILLSTPAVRAMKQRYPDAQVIYATDRRYAELLETNPWVDVVDDTVNAGENDLHIELDHEDVWRTQVHVIDKYLTLAETPGDADRTLDLILTQSDRRFARRLHARLPQRPTVVFHTRSNMACKDWPYEYWQALAEALSQEHNVIQVGREGEPPIDGVLDATGITAPSPLRKTAAILADADVVVCVDSCVQHMAAAMGIPAVVLWGGASSPEVSGHRDHLNIVTPSPCRCDRSKGYGNACPYELRCLEALTPEIVLDRMANAGLCGLQQRGG